MCCFTPLYIGQVTQCSEGCVFCRECLQKYVEMAAIGTVDVNLSCLSMSSHCEGVIPPAIARAATSPETWQHFTSREQAASLSLSSHGHLLVCHHCHYAVFLESPSDHPFAFKCPQCHKSTCSLCQRKSHGKLSCDEAEKRSSLLLKDIAEEMSSASIRYCANPLCHLPYQKAGGCSHLSCSCGTATCFVCRRDITSQHYDHFCRTAFCRHQRCGKCPLWVSEEMESREIHKAAYRHANSVKAPSTLVKSLLSPPSPTRLSPDDSFDLDGREKKKKSGK